MSWFRRVFWSAYMAYHVRGQARYPYRPLDAIKRDQDERVQRIVAYAYHFVPYYRETLNRLCLQPGDFRCADDLAKLPFLDRTRLQRDPEYYTSARQPISRYYSTSNSGTTGTPCTFFYDNASLYRDAAYGGRARAVIAPYVGKRVGFRKTMILPPHGAAAKLQGLYSTTTWLPPWVSVRRQLLSITDSPEKNLQLMIRFRPDVVYTYGSYLAEFFARNEALGGVPYRPKVIQYGSDSLPDVARRRIESDYHIPVFGLYEATEAYNLAFECEAHRGLHVNLDLHAVRIVDHSGGSLPVGECGQVVVSNLLNRATVLLNWRLNDRAALMPERCSCGRSLPLLSDLQGRNDDWLVSPSGKRVHPQSVIPPFANGTPVWQWQVVQESTRQYKFFVVASPQGHRDAIEDEVRAQFERGLGEPVNVDIIFVDEIPRTPGGKVKSVIAGRTGTPLLS